MSRNTFLPSRRAAAMVLWLSVSMLAICEPLENKVTSTGYSIIHNTKTDQSSYFGHLGNILHGYVYHKQAVPLSPPSPTTLLFNQNQLFGPKLLQAGQAMCAMAPPFCNKEPYRSFDGSCNHWDEPELGMANTRFGRLIEPKYGDGVSAPTRSITGNELPNARQLSVEVFGEENVPDPQFTLINMQWGQIITHDMSMQAGGTQSRKHPTRCCTDDGRIIAAGLHKTCFAILVSPKDPVYSQANIECLNFVRSLTDMDLNCPDSQHYAEQLTTVTAYMDLSLVYGSSTQQNMALREFQGGRMIVENRHGQDWLPSSQNSTSDCDASDYMEVCYRAGDQRVNQNPGLSVLQTILLREHNRLADTLAKLNPHWDDRTLFEEARKINIAQYQHINYYEWLPIFLGWENMEKNRLIYKAPSNSYINDFNPSIDPSVLNSHATGAFRYFHTQIEGRLDLVSEMRSAVGALRLSDWFNRPGIIELGDNFDSLSRGHATQPEQLTDNNIDPEIKHFLLRGNRPFGSDLKAIDIQRNRDHGLASYNDYREFCGLSRAHVWEDFTDLISLESIERMKSLYESPDDVDLNVGAALEAHVAGSLAGPTFLCILTEQFYRTRVGDRFFYESGDKHTGFTPDQLAEIRKANMARLLCDNGHNIDSMQSKAFLLISHVNPLLPCESIPALDLSKWAEGETYLTKVATPFYYGK